MPTLPEPSIDPDLRTANGGSASPRVSRYFIVMNPKSGSGDADETRQTIAAAFAGEGAVVEFSPVDQPSRIEPEARKAAERAATTGGAVVAVGGDGTLNTVAQAAWNADCPFGAIPQGTFNYFGRVNGLPLDAADAARALVRGSVDPVQVGEVNGRLFLVNASLGLYPQLLLDREAFKKQFGRYKWVAAIAGVGTLLKWRRQLRLDVEHDGKTERVRTPTLFVGNNRLQFEQLGFSPDIAGKVGDGELAAVATRPVGTRTLIWLMLRGAFGRLADADDVRSIAFRSLLVRTPGRRVRLAVDGEVSEVTSPLRFKVADHPLLLIRPAPEDRVAVG